MIEIESENTTRELTRIAMQIDEIVERDQDWPSNSEEALEYLDVVTDA